MRDGRGGGVGEGGGEGEDEGGGVGEGMGVLVRVTGRGERRRGCGTSAWNECMERGWTRATDRRVDGWNGADG